MLLLSVDEELADARRLEGCSCGGRLHVSDYPRKPRGLLVKGVWGEDISRFSFCCDRCRTRATPESVRFLGRRVWLALALVLVSPRPVSKTSKALFAVLLVPARTLRRWQRWWCEQFLQTRCWQRVCGHFLPPPAGERLPESLRGRFIGATAAELMLAFLRVLMPLTTGSDHAR